MSTDRETTRLVRSWLEEGVTKLPDRVLDAVIDQIPATPQRRSWWPAWRFANMNKLAPVAIAAAAVLVVAVIGYNLLPQNSGPGGPTVAPSSTAAPSATAMPQPTEVPRLPGNGSLNPGTYQMGTGPTILVTVPSGWVSSEETSLRKNVDLPNELALDVYRATMRVFADACQSEGTAAPIGPTTDDLIAALRAQANSVVSDPEDVTIGGLSGKRFEISAPTDLDTDGCSIGSLQVWVDASETNYLAGVTADAVATVYAADAPDGRLVIVLHAGSATPAEVAELEAVVASIEVT